MNENEKLAMQLLWLLMGKLVFVDIAGTDQDYIATLQYLYPCFVLVNEVEGIRQTFELWNLQHVSMSLDGGSPALTLYGIEQ